MAMLAREVLLPTSLIARPPEEPIEVTAPFAQTFRNNIRAAHQTIRESTRKAAKTQKCYFDKFVKGPPFAVNQKVRLYWPKALLRHKNKKLTRMWTGPWRIIEFKTAIVVIVQHEKTRKKQTVHVDRLVPCHNINVSLNNDTRENVERVQ